VPAHIWHQYQEPVGAGSPIALKGAERLNKPAPTPREIHLLTVQDVRFEIVINPNRPSKKKKKSTVENYE
jgi:hypothetical protein